MDHSSCIVFCLQLTLAKACLQQIQREQIGQIQREHVHIAVWFILIYVKYIHLL